MLFIVIGSLIGCLLLLGTACGIIYWRYKLTLKKNTYKEKEEVTKGAETTKKDNTKKGNLEVADDEDLNFENQYQYQPKSIDFIDIYNLPSVSDRHSENSESVSSDEELESSSAKDKE